MKNILLIEDEPQLIELYEAGIRKVDLSVETIRYGYLAEERLKEISEGKKGKPDLILLDLILPDMNGIVLLDQAKNNPATKDIPFFILTNYSDPELERLGIKLEAEQHLLKTDYTPSQLADLVKAWLDRH